MFVGIGACVFTPVLRHSHFENVPVCFESILASLFVAEDAFNFCFAARLFLYPDLRLSFHDMSRPARLHQNTKTRARKLAAFLAFNFLVAFKPATLSSLFHSNIPSADLPEYTASLEGLSDVSEGSLLPLLSFLRLVYSLSELNRFLNGCKSEEVMFNAIKTPLPTKVLLDAVANDQLFHLLVLTVDSICGTAESRTGEAMESRQNPPPWQLMKTISLMGADHHGSTGKYSLVYIRYNDLSSIELLAFENSGGPPYRFHWISPDDYRLDLSHCLYVHEVLCKSLAAVYFFWC